MLRILMLLFLAGTLPGCDVNDVEPGRVVEQLPGPTLIRQHDASQVARGESMYRRYCAECHGPNGEGHPAWRVRGADNMFPPPPLNGTGHAWHHSKVWLKDMILNGSRPGQGKMPAWRDILEEQEAMAIIEWFQSQWPDRAYAAWLDMQK